MTTSTKAFKVQHGPPGARILETPRLLGSIYGDYKSLCIGNNTIIATVHYDAPDEELWQKARDYFKPKSTTQSQI